jgi:hypothetical protein
MHVERSALMKVILIVREYFEILVRFVSHQSVVVAKIASRDASYATTPRVEGHRSDESNSTISVQGLAPQSDWSGCALPGSPISGFRERPSQIPVGAAV